MPKHPRCSQVPRAPVPLRRPDSVSTARYRVFRAVAIAASLLLGLFALQGPSPSLEAPDAGVPGAAESPAVFSDAATLDSEAVASLRVPERPPEWQETRCEPTRDEVPINGGCYRELARKPPCSDGSYEHDGRCWGAVAKRSRPATSIKQ